MSTQKILESVFNKINNEFNIDDHDLFRSKKIDYLHRHMSDTPIDTVSYNWETKVIKDYNTLMKTFDFKTKKELMYFLGETLTLSDDFKIFIDGKKITMQVYTIDLKDVTEDDIKIAKEIDEIYDDIQFIQDI